MISKIIRANELGIRVFGKTSKGVDEYFYISQVANLPGGKLHKFKNKSGKVFLIHESIGQIHDAMFINLFDDGLFGVSIEISFRLSLMDILKLWIKEVLRWCH